LLERTGATLAILRELRGQLRVPYLPRKQLAALRDARVREIAAVAAQAPYYRDFFAREGLDPRELRSADDLARLPLVEKRDVQQGRERFEPVGLRDSVVPFPTTGSTGIPLEVLHDRRSLIRNIAWGERERVIEAELCGRRYSYRVAQITHALANDRRVRSYYDRAAFRPGRPRLHLLSVADPLEDVLDAIERLRPPVVRGYGSYLEALYRLAFARGGSVHRPRVIVYMGDAMSRETRDLIEDRLGVPVLDHYGAAECLKIGYTCPAGGFHLHEDLAHVRIINGRGDTLPPGTPGEVVISNLVNRGTVLLNYRLGDVAALAEPGCSCGRTSRLLVGFEGRSTEVVRLPDGEPVHSMRLNTLVRRRREVLQFQLKQESRACFRLLLVTARPTEFSRLAEELVPELAAVLRGCTIEIEQRDWLTEGDGRKLRALVPLPATDAR
jgi:phenylacetate-CoA ligase